MNEPICLMLPKQEKNLKSWQRVWNRNHSGHPICDSLFQHYSDVIMSTMTSQITSLETVYPIVYSGTDQRKYRSFASLAFVRGIHRSPVNSPHKGSVMRKTFPFHDIIMKRCISTLGKLIARRSRDKPHPSKCPDVAVTQDQQNHEIKDVTILDSDFVTETVKGNENVAMAPLSHSLHMIQIYPAK